MPDSAFINVGLNIKCTRCGHESKESIGIHKDGTINFITYCGTPHHQRREGMEWAKITGCGASIKVKGKWNYKIESIKCES